MARLKKAKKKTRKKAKRKPAKKAAPNTTKDIIVPDGLQKPDVFKMFVSWMALPSGLRKPSTQGGFAIEFGVSPDTLSDWKKIEAFWDAVSQLRKAWGKGKTSDILASLYSKAMSRDRGTADFRLWLEYFEDLDVEAKAAPPVINVNITKDA